MKQLNNLLDHLLTRVEQDWQLKLRAEWSTIMGDLSSRARLERILDTTVVIGVYDSHWMHELHALSRMILARINTSLVHVYPEGFVLKQVRCIWVAKQKSRSIRRTLPVQEPVAPPVTPARNLVQHVHKVASPQLHEALLAYYQRCHREGRR